MKENEFELLSLTKKEILERRKTIIDITDRALQLKYLEKDMPIGCIIYTNDFMVDDFFMRCDGRPLSKNTYDKLYQTIGDKYSDCKDEYFFNIPKIDGFWILATKPHDVKISLYVSKFDGSDCRKLCDVMGFA